MGRCELRHCRITVCDRAAHEPLAAWLPLMESVAGAGEALLVVTETIGSELLSTFVVNAIKGTLPVCAVHPARERYGSPAPGTRYAIPPTEPNQLPRIDEVWIRRRATACFPRRTIRRGPLLLSRISPSSKPAAKTTRINTTGCVF